MAAAAREARCFHVLFVGKGDGRASIWWCTSGHVSGRAERVERPEPPVSFHVPPGARYISTGNSTRRIDGLLTPDGSSMNTGTFILGLSATAAAGHIRPVKKYWLLIQLRKGPGGTIHGLQLSAAKRRSQSHLGFPEEELGHVAGAEGRLGFR
ncbi:unnamed protein product [Pleuronectes platessa]|uniref:Uncharacterized protein n=1 Tax=Pleuronectes platessa TaxID=8262 RepID=A0A9N7UXL7_PLEPL|nr:unnamed protein product [Pleuronectes platessa]